MKCSKRLDRACCCGDANAVRSRLRTDGITTILILRTGRPALIVLPLTAELTP